MVRIISVSFCIFIRELEKEYKRYVRSREDKHKTRLLRDWIFGVKLCMFKTRNVLSKKPLDMALAHAWRVPVFVNG